MTWTPVLPRSCGGRSCHTPGDGVSVGVQGRGKESVGMLVCIGLELAASLGWQAGDLMWFEVGAGGADAGLAKIRKGVDGWKLRRRRIKGNEMPYLEFEVTGTALGLEERHSRQVVKHLVEDQALVITLPGWAGGVMRPARVA